MLLMCIWKNFYTYVKISDKEKDKTLLSMIRQNTRQPVETEGDVYSLARVMMLVV